MGANGKIKRDCTKLAALARCPLKRGGLKQSFHCTYISKFTHDTIQTSLSTCYCCGIQTSAPSSAHVITNTTVDIIRKCVENGHTKITTTRV